MKSDGDLRGDADCHSQCANWARNDTVNKKRGGAAGHMGPALQPHILQGRARVPCRECGAESAGGQRRPPLRKRNKRCNGRATARVAPTKYNKRCDRYRAAGRGQPTLHYIMLLCGAWGRGCKRPFARQQGGGAPRPVGGIFVSYLFRSSKLSAVTMDWTLVHRGAKVLARSS